MRAFARGKPVGCAQRPDNTRRLIGMLTGADHHRGIAALAIRRTHRSARAGLGVEWLTAQSGDFTADLIGGKRRLRRFQNLLCSQRIIRGKWARFHFDGRFCIAEANFRHDLARLQATVTDRATGLF